jgi:hypothetical protein
MSLIEQSVDVATPPPHVDLDAGLRGREQAAKSAERRVVDMPTLEA